MASQSKRRLIPSSILLTSLCAFSGVAFGHADLCKNSKTERFENSPWLSEADFHEDVQDNFFTKACRNVHKSVRIVSKRAETCTNCVLGVHGSSSKVKRLCAAGLGAGVSPAWTAVWTVARMMARTAAPHRCGLRCGLERIRRRVGGVGGGVGDGAAGGVFVTLAQALPQVSRRYVAGVDCRSAGSVYGASKPSRGPERLVAGVPPKCSTITRASREKSVWSDMDSVARSRYTIIDL